MLTLAIIMFDYQFVKHCHFIWINYQSIYPEVKCFLGDGARSYANNSICCHHSNSHQSICVYLSLTEKIPWKIKCVFFLYHSYLPTVTCFELYLEHGQGVNWLAVEGEYWRMWEMCSREWVFNNTVLAGTLLSLLDPPRSLSLLFSAICQHVRLFVSSTLGRAMGEKFR